LLIGFSVAQVVNLGRRNAELVAEGRQMRVTTKGLFGTRKESGVAMTSPPFVWADGV